MERQPRTLQEITIDYLKKNLPEDCLDKLYNTQTVYVSPCYGAFTLQGLKQHAPESCHDGVMDWDYLFFHYNLFQIVLDPRYDTSKVYCLILLPTSSPDLSCCYCTNSAKAMKKRIYHLYRTTPLWEKHEPDCWCNVSEPVSSTSAQIQEYVVDSIDNRNTYTLQKFYQSQS